LQFPGRRCSSCWPDAGLRSREARDKKFLSYEAAGGGCNGVQMTKAVRYTATGTNPDRPGLFYSGTSINSSFPPPLAAGIGSH